MNTYIHIQNCTHTQTKLYSDMCCTRIVLLVLTLLLALLTFKGDQLVVWGGGEGRGREGRRGKGRDEVKIGLGAKRGMWEKRGE